MHAESALRRFLPALPKLHVAKFVMRLDAAWRESHAMRQLDESRLEDVGLARADIDGAGIADILRR